MTDNAENVYPVIDFFFQFPFNNNSARGGAGGGGIFAGWGRIFNRVTRMGLVFGVRQFFIFTVSKRNRMFLL